MNIVLFVCVCQVRDFLCIPPYIFIPLPLYYYALLRSKTPLFPFLYSVLIYPTTTYTFLIVYSVSMCTNYAYYLPSDYCILYYVKVILKIRWFVCVLRIVCNHSMDCIGKLSMRTLQEHSSIMWSSICVPINKIISCLIIATVLYYLYLSP